MTGASLYYGRIFGKNLQIPIDITIPGLQPYDIFKWHQQPPSRENKNALPYGGAFKVLFGCLSDFIITHENHAQVPWKRRRWGQRPIGLAMCR